MMNTQNPYSDLIAIMQSQGTKYNPPHLKIGKVTNPLPQLLIIVDELQLDRDNLLMSEHLLDHTRTAGMAATAGCGETAPAEVGEHGVHSHNIAQVGFAEGEINFRECLRQGDLVALLPLEKQQTYIVLCKVVSLNG
ncbi:MAG: hypothetical protein APF84_05815 [Gracilibacter sp. BRH_c7a]|nr:MAG: hypothetical protein APF84_05815 [Gracilibacter sp. BRH_c7a]